MPDLDKITKLVMEVIRRAALVDDARKAGDPIRALREARGLEVAAHDVATALHNELKKT